MKKRIFLLLFSSLSLMSYSQNMQVAENISIPTKIVSQGDNLDLNGYALREAKFYKLYFCSLYLSEKSTDPKVFLDQNKPVALRFHIISSLVQRSRWENTITQGFQSSTGGNITGLESRIELIKNIVKSEYKDDDIFLFSYSPVKKTTIIYLNDIQVGSVEGEDFKKAFFGIYFGEKPWNQVIKDGMLGIKKF
ncbi:chalcone isomerase family protein [Flavobacterium psychrophilum]|nr:chalcone isomerase family protein [Flavobacterium psychrophilum]ELY2018505.1 chalcone isomerase family protein [Flavobacterium psychrophilum]